MTPEQDKKAATLWEDLCCYRITKKQYNQKLKKLFMPKSEAQDEEDGDNAWCLPPDMGDQ